MNVAGDLTRNKVYNRETARLIIPIPAAQKKFIFSIDQIKLIH